jgi:hypothetical protein
MTQTTKPEEKPKSIYQKIAVVQATIGVLEKDKTNPAFRSKYVDVNTIAEKIIPLMADQNILMTMPVSIGEEGKQIISLYFHDLDTGEEICPAAAYLPENVTIQQLGSAITYLRRYLPVSYFYLQAEDDDGNQASTKPERPAQKPATRPEAQHQGDDIPVIVMDDSDPLAELTK